MATQAKKNSNNQDSVRSQIRASGANGNLSKKELLKISESSGKSSSQVIKQLDSVNAKLINKGGGPIGLGGAAANAYSKGKLGPVNNPFLGGGKSGTGPIATALGQMMDRTTGSMLGQGQGVRTTPGTGLIPKGQQIFGSYNEAPQLRTKPSLSGYAMQSGTSDTSGTGGTSGAGATSSTSINTGSNTGNSILPTTPEEVAQGGMSNPYSMTGASVWRTQKGKKKGMKSTSAATANQRKSVTWKTLGV